MVGGGMGSYWTCFALLAVASAGPLHRYPRESEDYQNDLSAYANYTANEVCFSEGEVFQKGDIMPNPGPCEECRCEPPSIVCNMIKCPVNNNGCRTIQRANHCCPDYNCVCDYNGQLYNDGERLELPEEPCQVCYCKGGEVMCNSITCYHRDDCDPIQVPGQCCPKYENCPVRDMGSSSSVDKNVLVRSTNKTGHVPPKREMNPWLLTKLPPVSSSPPPKNSEGPTTEGGNIVIVSDWLTERRTTPEDATSPDHERPDYNFVSTDEPDLFTNSNHFTTDLKQDFSSYGTMIMKNSDTITPVDEVIFTRIDGPNQNKEVNLEESTSISSKDTQNKLNGTLIQEHTSELNITEAPLNVTNINKDLKAINSFSNLSEKQNVSEKSPIEITVHIQTPTETPIKIQESGTHYNLTIPMEAPVYSSAFNVAPETKGTNTDSVTTQKSVDLTVKLPTKDVEKDIMVGNIFGLDKLSFRKIEQETTTKDLLQSQTTESGKSAADVNEFTTNSLHEQTKEAPKIGKVKIPLNEDKTTLEGFTDTTAIDVSDTEFTTPFFTEVNLEKGNLNKHEYASELTNSLNSNKNEKTISSTVNQEVGSTRENTLFPGTGTTKTTYPSEINTKRDNFNNSSAQNNSKDITESSILLNVSNIPVITKETTIIPEINSTSQNLSLNKTSLNAHKVPPTGLAEDFALPTLVNSGDEFEGDMESTSDAPPVLELNSHVPFLQLGGHENTDSVMNTFGESSQTTITDVNATEAAFKDSAPNITNSFDNHGLLVKEMDSTDDKPRLKYSEGDNLSTTQEIEKHIGENDQVTTETTTDMIFSTSHIPLTPGDLKVIAEYLINDTIKTVPVKNVSDYVPKPWLKGNLTSEEKMSSILSAANISIAIMNKTDDKAKKLITEPTTRPGEAIILEKLEKDKLLTGKSAMNNLKVGNKTGFIQGKGDEYLDSPKLNSEPETPLNDEAEEALKTDKKTNTESPNYIKKSTIQNTTPNTNENSPAKFQINNLKPRNKNDTQFQTSTPQPINIQRQESHDSCDNDLRFDNVNPAGDAETHQYAQNNSIRNEELSDVTATSATTSHPQQPLAP